MTDTSRREFLRKLGVAAGVGALGPGLAAERGEAAEAAGAGAAGGPASSAASGPFIRDGSASGPVVISSSNGLETTERAMELLRQGADTLEAAVSGVNLVEEDPEDYTVGYGGLPNYLGEVQLDSQVWHGPTRGAGAVAALEGFVNPSRVAMAVMRYTDHVMLMGEGAAQFAREFGFEEEELLTEWARRRWLRWRAEMSDDDDYLTPEQSGEPIEGYEDPGGAGAMEERADEQAALMDPAAVREKDEGWLHSGDGHRPWGTIHCSAVNAAGEVSSVTTTSGLFFKVPGRVGDSPLPGCGCYCDNDVGGAGGTGRGEAVIKTIGAHTIVEAMRRGEHPTDACVHALERLVDWTVEDRLLRDDGRPAFNVNYYAVNREGEHGGAALWAGARYAVHDGTESRREDSAYLFEED